MIIYKTTNLINGKIYIGQDTIDRDWYLGSGKILKNAIEKYGKENFQKETIETCETVDELNEREVYWIAKLKSRDSDIGYNIAKGGFGCTGFKQSDEMKTRAKEYSNSDEFKSIMRSDKVRANISAGQKNSEKRKKTQSSKEYRDKMSKSLMGRKMSPEAIKKTADALRGRSKTEEHKKSISESLKKSMKGEGNSFYGKKHSEETRAKIRESLKKYNEQRKK